jgi:phosphoribosylamine--glycine ligase
LGHEHPAAGFGRREHALAWKLAQSPRAKNSMPRRATPASPSMPSCVSARRDATMPRGRLLRRQHIGLVVVGPEAPLVDGLADALRARASRCSGRQGGAAQLEGSKGFTKDLCARAEHPDRRLCARDLTRPRRWPTLPKFGLPVVIKADGLAAGKGVIIAETRAKRPSEALATCSPAASARRAPKW